MQGRFLPRGLVHVMHGPADLGDAMGLLAAGGRDLGHETADKAELAILRKSP